MVQPWVKTGQRPERKGCKLIDLELSTVRYKSKGRDDAVLPTRLEELAQQYPRYGYPTLLDRLRDEGSVTNPKRTYRIYTQEQLQVRRKKRKKLIPPRVPMAVNTRENERWSIDFVSDQLATGRCFRVSNILDDFTRECVGQLAGTSTSGTIMAHFIDTLGQLPKTIVCDNVPRTGVSQESDDFWCKEA